MTSAVSDAWSHAKATSARRDPLARPSASTHAFACSNSAAMSSSTLSGIPGTHSTYIAIALWNRVPRSAALPDESDQGASGFAHAWQYDSRPTLLAVTLTRHRPFRTRARDRARRPWGWARAPP